MENRKKINAEKLAEQLWSSAMSKPENLMTDAAKEAHIRAFFKKHQLSPSQQKAVLDALTQTIEAEENFKPSPNILELYDLWTHKQFHYFFKNTDTQSLSMTPNDFDFSRYFDEKKIPIWQRDKIIEGFQLYMNAKARENRKKIIVPLLVCFGGALVLAFLTPMILQKLGWLSPDAGWGVKTVNVIGSFIFLFLIAKRVNNFWLNKVLLGK
jgi:hypothetical protein